MPSTLSDLHKALDAALSHHPSDVVERLKVVVNTSIPTSIHHSHAVGLDSYLLLQPSFIDIKGANLLPEPVFASDRLYGYFITKDAEVEKIKFRDRELLSMIYRSSVIDITSDELMSLLSPSQRAGICQENLSHPTESISTPGIFPVVLPELHITVPLKNTAKYRHYLMGYSKLPLEVKACDVLSENMLVQLDVPERVALTLVEMHKDLLEAKLRPIEKAMAVKQDKLINAYRDENISSNALTTKATEINNYYPNNVTNYIVGAPDDDTSIRRRQFIEYMKRLFEEPRKDYVRHNFSQNFSKVFMEKLDSLFLTDNHVRLMEEIDNGYLPVKEIATAFKLPGLSKKEFLKAFACSHPMDEALYLSRLPSYWLDVTNKDGTKTNILMDVFDRNKILLVEDDLQHTMYHSLLQASKGLAKHLSLIADLPDVLSNTQEQTKRDAETAILQLSKSWEWMSQVGGEADNAIRRLEKEHNVVATFEDYHSILNTLSDPLIKRMLHTHPDMTDDMFNVNNERLLVRPVSSVVKAAFDDSFKENMDFTHTSNLNDEVKKNTKLHTNISQISKQLAGFGKINVALKPLTDKAVQLGDYILSPIKNRFELLDEAIEMDNYVYANLRRHMTSKSALIKVTDLQGVRIAMVEMEQSKSDENTFCHRVVEINGYKNSEVSLDMWDAFNIYSMKLDTGFIAHNDISKKHDGDCWPDKKWSFEECADIESVPFLTDAAYYAAGYLDEYLPQGTSVVDCLNNMGVMARDSGFMHEVKALHDIAMRTNCKLSQVVDYCFSKDSATNDATNLSITEVMEEYSINGIALSESFRGSLSNAIDKAVIMPVNKSPSVSL